MIVAILRYDLCNNFIVTKQKFLINQGINLAE